MLREAVIHTASYLPNIGIAMLTFLIFWVLSKFSVTFIAHIAEKKSPQKQPVFLVLTVAVKWTILLIGSITALGSAGVHVGALITSLGLSGFALSFASRDAFANLMGGILVLLYQPFNIGDLIEVDSLKGEVSKMSLRYTHLKHEDKEILIPNASLLTNSIVIKAQ